MFLPRIKERTDAILNITTGGGVGMTLDERRAGEMDQAGSVLAAGRHQVPMITLSAILGGNARIELEDSLTPGKALLAMSNAEQVAKIQRILKELSLDIASPDEARAMLQTKGGNNVAF